MKTACFFLLSLCLLAACTSNPSTPSTDPPVEPSVVIPKGPFLGLQPDSVPQLLYPNFISTEMGEYNGTFSPDGQAFYYTISIPQYDAIMVTEMQVDGQWSTPEIASFSGQKPEYDPLFAPDGQRLYFSSQRPTEPDGPSGRTNIWYLDKTPDGWSEPVYVRLTERGDYFSSLTSDGKIYFNVWQDGDLYRAIPRDTGYQVERLPDSVNSPQGEGDLFVAPDESYLIFRSYRPGGIGSGDFYISFNNNGEWTVPENLGAPINSRYNEMCPYVTTDGRLFIFASNRLDSYYDVPPAAVAEVRQKYNSTNNGNQNIYAISADFIKQMKQRALGE